jgi:3-deoxy-7-phosphoheptulonate synthase
MIIVMTPGASEQDIQQVIKRLEARGYGHHVSRGVERTLIGAIGTPEGEKEAAAEQLLRLPAVERVIPILKPYKFVSREHQRAPLPVKIGDFPFGGTKIGVIAGPCSVESREQTVDAARAVKAAGAVVLRGGAYKPRTSVYAFQGLGERGLDYLESARGETGLPIVTEVTDIRQVEALAARVDALQIGARNMHNFDLLKEVGSVRKPIVLKRGWAATVGEWLRAAEYIAASGNLNIILCERGIRTYETETRFTLDLSGLAVAKMETHLPVIADPSHATGTHKLVPQMALAAIAAGADGVMVEVHPHPDQALCDGPQSLTPKRFMALMQDVRKVAEAVGREL